MKGPMITTRTANIWLDADGIMHKEFLPNAQETIEDARESGEIMRKLSSNKRTPLLVDFTQVRGVTPEPRAYYSDSEAAYLVLAFADITN